MIFLAPMAGTERLLSRGARSADFLSIGDHGRCNSGVANRSHEKRSKQTHARA
jgi:hypothetical protein